MSQKHLPHRIKLRLHRIVVRAGCGLLFGQVFACLIAELFVSV
ncbi:MAG: hypothetical protein NTZ32_07905 [Planctomycetales bacterium]|nr:hypothetical protein [Planctomycetales bacterium]